MVSRVLHTIIATILGICLLAAGAFAQGATRLTGAEIDTAFAQSANIAAAALGGEVQASHVEDYDGYSAAYLIDGIEADESQYLNPSKGWSATASKGPIDLVFAFHEDQPATILGLAMTPWRWTTTVPTNFEVFVSETGRDNSWKAVEGPFGLDPSLERQGFRFASPVKARVLWIRLHSNAGANTYNIGEVEIFEDPAQSILADREVDLAQPALGGALVRPPRGETFADAAIDGDPSTGFISNSPGEPIVLTHRFRDGASALVRSIQLRAFADTTTPPPQSIRVEYSTGTNPIGRFEMIGEAKLRWKDGIADLPITPAFHARYVRLTLYPETSANLAIADSRILEGVTDGYVSVIAQERDAMRPDITATTGADRQPEPVSDNDAVSARPITPGTELQGEVWPLQDVDFIRIGAAPAQSRQFVTVTRRAGSQPNITLIRSNGEETDLQPDTPSEVHEGDMLRLSRPVTSSTMLLIDDSGSMRGTSDNVIDAIGKYLASRRPNDQTAILRFAGTPELLADFKRDAAVLLASLDGKISQTGSTALYDALLKATEMLEGRAGDKAIVLLSDGANSTGYGDLQTMWDRLTNAGIRVYSIGLGSGLDYYGSTIGLSATPWEVLQMLGDATSGQAVRTFAAGDLERVYDLISADLRTPSEYSVALVAEPIRMGEFSVRYSGGVLLGQDAPLFEIILDASGSMRSRKNKIDGKLKIDVARAVISDLIDTLPDGLNVGLRAFGHRVREGEKYDCSDVELVVPYGPLRKSAMKAAVNSIKPLGTTPIYTALLLALGDLKDAGPGPKKVILITDGKEECTDPRDVIGLASKFGVFGVDLKLDIVGFALADDETKDVMTQAAEVTGGVFTDAQDAAALLAGLTDAFPNAGFVIRDANGVAIESMVGAGPISLEAGTYSVDLLLAGGTRTIDGVTIASNQRLILTLSRNASGQLQYTGSVENL